MRGLTAGTFMHPLFSRANDFLSNAVSSAEEQSRSAAKSIPPKRRALKRSSSFKRLTATAALAKEQRRKTLLQKKLGRATSERSEQRLHRIIWQLQVTCVLYSMLVLLPRSFSSAGSADYSGSSIIVCPRPNVCSVGIFEVALLALARTTAYCMLPAIVAVFASKCRVLVTLLEQTSLSLWIPLSDLHGIHVAMGKNIAGMAFLHTVAHLIRWSQRGELSRLYIDVCGRSGAIVALACVPVVLLMAMKIFRDRLSWELRIRIHVCGALVFGIGLAFHTPLLAYFMTSVVLLYGLDSLACAFKMTHRVPHSSFMRLGSGTQLRFKNPAGWNSSTTLGYVRVCVPWLSKSQWHPFSFYPDATDPSGSSAVFIQCAGDWTRDLHKSVERDSRRPIWIQGPFASPYAAALDYDHLLLFATGIGITPAVACLQQYREDRQVNLIWSCRDAALVRFYVHNFKFSSSSQHAQAGFTLIFYTGKAPLQIECELPDTVRILTRRPVLHEVCCFRSHAR